jgi:hypothetical protein
MSEVNFAELEEKYGKELAERIRREIEICEQFGHEYEIWMKRGLGAIDKIFFSTSGDTVIFEVNAEKQIIIDKHRFTRADCEKSLEAMDRLWEREINCSSTSTRS